MTGSLAAISTAIGHHLAFLRAAPERPVGGYYLLKGSGKKL